MASIIHKALRMGEGKKLKKLEERVASVSFFEEELKALSDAELTAKTAVFKQRLADGETLDEILSEAFAVVREASRRALGMRHFDVQIMGGIALHEGNIAEMRTGEGKTLVATLPIYLNALAGTGVHLVTVNDYLASRDAEWMRPVYNLLGMEVGVLQDNMHPAERRPAYAADITYGTNSEFGFDYLRDNMAIRPEDLVQRGHAFAIVDEVDSILIDEARTPLIISGSPEQAASTYREFAAIVPMLKAEVDYEVEEKHRNVAITESGVAKVEKALGLENLYESRNGQLVNHLIQALKAHTLFKKDVQYVVKDGEVLIVDEFTGRIMEGRRYSEGLHQAIEAKEKVHVREENQTIATITIQNYFRMYDKLSGMTGTAATEADEFMHIYKLEVISIPPNVPMVRDDRNDLIYKTKKGKYKAVAEDIAECFQARPAGAGRHHLGRDQRAHLGDAQAPRRRSRRAERQAPRQGSRDHHARRPEGERHHRHQHGRPRRRHQDRRRSQGAGRPLCDRHRAPREPPHRQSAARPFRPSGRPGRLALLSLRRGRCHPPVRRRPHLQHHGQAGRR